MTRQQEGDEAMKPALRPSEEAICWHCSGVIWRCTDEAGIRGGWKHRDTCPTFYCQHPKTHAEPKPVQTEDETTLPALSESAIAHMQGEDHLYGTAYRERERQLIAALRERDALKAEVEQIKKLFKASEDWRTAYQTGKYELYAMGGDILEAAASHLPCNEGPLDRQSRKAVGRPEIRSEVARAETAESDLATLKAQLDAVVGQETPQDAYNRGFSQAIWDAKETASFYRDAPQDLPEGEVLACSNAMNTLMVDLEKMTAPPYTPPLKAGTE